MKYATYGLVLLLSAILGGAASLIWGTDTGAFIFLIVLCVLTLFYVLLFTIVPDYPLKGSGHK